MTKLAPVNSLIITLEQKVLPTPRAPCKKITSPATKFFEINLKKLIVANLELKFFFFH